MTRWILRLALDGIAAKAQFDLPPAPRFVYVRDGDAIVRMGGAAAAIPANAGMQGAGACAVEGGPQGANLLRWELVPEGAASARAGTGVATREILSRAIELVEPSGYLMRADRVDFPLGGVAWTHTHRGPGIRCLVRGSIRVDAAGETHAIAPGEAWFEAGPDPVLARASDTELTSFVRVMLLPRELKGKSSIRYVDPADADKPKTQRYQVFADEFVEL